MTNDHRSPTVSAMIKKVPDNNSADIDLAYEGCRFGPADVVDFKPVVLPPAPKPKIKPKPSPTLAIANVAQGADVVENLTAPGVLSILAGKIFKDQIPTPSYQLYRDQFLAGCGQPSDPLERMMLEQQVWAHFRIGGLHAQAAVAESPEHVELFTAAATKIMAEFRRMSLAIREYRSPLATKNVTVVKQQNVAAGDQQIALVEPKVLNETVEKRERDIELGSNEPRLTYEELPDFNTTSTCRPAEPLETKRFNGHRTIRPASVSVGEPTLDGFNGAENSGG